MPMSKYKVGDKFIIEIDDVMLGSTAENNPTALYRIKGFNSLVFDKNGLDKLEKIPTSDVKDWSETIEAMEREYNRGLNDVWELARKVSHMCLDDMNKCFDLEELDKYGADMMLYEHYTVQEALAKIEAYEVSQQIQVGDVVYADDEPDSVGVVTHMDSERLYIMWNDGSSNKETNWSDIHKTGRHIDIEHLLEQIKGE